ncbi:MAG: sigma-54-dependent Fis family transcriptional regulator [Deltaproteobacteria bacterium]|nr:sigma-54-dependent Fis family transcriptional regulator [Deltaproteobacteria bacterium]
MNTKSILIVDDEQSLRTTLAENLTDGGYAVETAGDGVEALKKFENASFEAVITDVRLPGMNGIDVLRGVKKISLKTPVIVITGYGTVDTAVEAMKEGAADFMMKPFSFDHIEMILRDVLRKNGTEEVSELEVCEPSREKSFITGDDRMKNLLTLLKNVAGSSASILIQGESGTGKELLARYVHKHSSRARMPFVAVNCAAIPHHLLESEMFGYEKGAFTGASMRRAGKFELASGGTLLLDEIGEMDIQLQAKLLRVIQESEVDRLGAKEPVPVDVRIIATTNADIKACIRENKFRSDLYYRLNVVPVTVPPLRSRRGDIAVLAAHFLRKYSRVNKKKRPTMSKETVRLLERYEWPGNVRELENVMERSVLLCDGDVIQSGHLCLEQDGFAPSVPSDNDDVPTVDVTRFDGSTLRDVERNLIFETLIRVNGNRTRASEILGISVRTMRNKLNEYKRDGDMIESAMWDGDLP